MIVVALVSTKGGVGRTTLTANLAAALHAQGRTVYAVEMDPQNSLQWHLGCAPGNVDGLARATIAGTAWRNATRMAGNVTLLPHGALDEVDRLAFEQALYAQPDLLQRHLLALAVPDNAVVLIDSASGPSVYQRQALNAADIALMVMLPDAASFAGMTTMTQQVQAHGRTGAKFFDTAVIVNQIDNARQLAKDVVRVLPGALDDLPLGRIHRDESVAEALACQALVADYAPNSMAVADIALCAQALSARIDAAQFAQDAQA